MTTADRLRLFEVHVFEHREHHGVVYATDEASAKTAALRALADGDLDTVHHETNVYPSQPAPAASANERRWLHRLHAVVAELRDMQARHARLVQERHSLTAKVIATGGWNFSGLSVELGYERTHLAVEFNRRTKLAKKHRKQQAENLDK